MIDIYPKVYAVVNTIIAWVHNWHMMFYAALFYLIRASEVLDILDFILKGAAFTDTNNSTISESIKGNTWIAVKI